MSLKYKIMDYSKILISIVTITYNQEKYIINTLEGVLMQEYKGPIEIIIANDKSPDKTDKVINQYFKNRIIPCNIEIKYTCHEENKGVSSNFIWALKQAKGKYIAFCEGDDYWTDPLKLQKQVDYLEKNPKYGLVYTDVDFYNQNTRKFLRAVFNNKHIYQSTDFDDHLINTGFLAPLTWLFKKDILSAFDIGSHTDSSFALMLEIFIHSKVYYLNEVTAVYRISDGSASRPKDINKRFRYIRGVFETQKEYLNKYREGDEKLKKRVLTGAYFKLYTIAMKLNDEVLVNEIEDYMNNENITIRPIKAIIEKNIKVDNIIELLRKYKVYGLLKRFFSKNNI